MKERSFTLITSGSQRVNTQTYTAHDPVFFLLSARLNFNIPLEKELQHNDNSTSGKQILTCFSGQGTTNTEILFLTNI